MLLNDARSVRERLMRVEAASSGIEEAEALRAKRSELQALTDRIIALARRNAMLREMRVLLTPVPGVDKVKQVINQISARFAELPKAATLVEKQRWSKLVLTLTEFTASAEALQKQDWKVYFSSKLFAGVPPEQRKQTIVQSLPENQKRLERYTYLYQRFNQYRNSIPSTIEALREVHAHSDELATIRFLENDDIPIPVKAFFDATSSWSGADLDFLTQEVIEWLRTNNMLTNYVVRAR